MSQRIRLTEFSMLKELLGIDLEEFFDGETSIVEDVVIGIIQVGLIIYNESKE